MDTAKSLAQRIEVELATPIHDRWDVVDSEAEDGVIHVCAENDDGDTVTFDLRVENVNYEIGPPRKEDFEPDREEPGDEPYRV